MKTLVAFGAWGTLRVVARDVDWGVESMCGNSFHYGESFDYPQHFPCRALRVENDPRALRGALLPLYKQLKQKYSDLRVAVRAFRAMLSAALNAAEGEVVSL